MNFADILKGLNDGGFQFLGMLFIAGILVGGARAFAWAAKFIPAAWAELNKTIKDSGTEQTANVDRVLVQNEKLMERNATMLDGVMSTHRENITEARNLVSEVRILTNRLGGKE